MSGECPVPRCAQGGLKTVTMFGMTINNVTLEDVFQAVTRQIEAREPGYVLTPNVDHVCEFQVNPEFREAYKNGFLVLPDGTPIIWASKLLGTPLREKVSGSDLVFWLTQYSALKGYSIFFLGAAEGIAQRAATILEQRYPGFKVAGTYSPPLGFDNDPDEVQKTVEIVRRAAPDICYVALGSPKGDLWNCRNHKEIGVPVQIGIGGSLDLVTGNVKRAPKWMQRSGLEWLWRLIQEPRRLAKRYLIRDSLFLPLLMRELVRRRHRHETSPADSANE